MPDRPAYAGLTWDHPRGRAALEAAAQQAGQLGLEVDVDWQVHPLEGFESSPIDELARRYDLIVLDHPHMGDAYASGSLQPLDGWLPAESIERWRSEVVGPAFDSYVYEGHLWALPLDVATQVGVHRPDLLATPPTTWDEVLEVSTSVPVALSLAGPHALLSFESVCVSLGEVPADGNEFISEATGTAVLDIMSTLAGRAPAGTESANPIGLLEQMSSSDQIAYIPLVFGYVNYSAADQPLPLAFCDAPVGKPGGRHGSVLGGTGLALSSRCEPTPELAGLFAWLLSPDAQCRFIPDHEGQPSIDAAWTDPDLNARFGDFYRATRATVEDAWIRPRQAGVSSFQDRVAALIRDRLGDRDQISTIRQINRLYRELNEGTQR